MTNVEKINTMYDMADKLVKRDYTTPFDKYPQNYPEIHKGEQVFLRTSDVQSGKPLDDCMYVIVSSANTIDTENDNICFFKGLSRIDPTDSIAAYVEKDNQILHFQEHATPMCTYEAANWSPDNVLFLVDKSTVPMEEEEFSRVMLKDNINALFNAFGE